MKNIVIRFLLIFVSVSPSTPVFANDDEISIVGGVAYNWKNEDFEIGGKPFKPEFTTIDWILVAAYKSAYVRVNFDQSIKDSFVVDNSTGSSSTDNRVILFSRDDIGLTFGYSLSDTFSLFAGYLRGGTEGVGTANYYFDGGASFPGDAVISNIDITIKEQGPFAGASYNYHLPDSGSFIFTLAYALLDGEVRLENSTTRISDGALLVDSQFSKGDTRGLSYSITWTDKFSELINYTISLKITDYKFDAPEVAGEDTLDFDDEYTSFGIGLSKLF